MTSTPDQVPSSEELIAFGFRPFESRSDLVIGCILLAFYAVQILLIVFARCPYWSLCFPLTPIAPYIWVVVAVVAMIRLAPRAKFRSSLSRIRVMRAILAIALALCAIDTMTGGNYRWFELGMRRELRQVGGATALQTCAQQTLESPEILARFEGGNMFPTDVPPQFRPLASKFHPLYRSPQTGGPFFMFYNGGWDMGWGVIVGKANLVDPSPKSVGPGDRAGWTKEIQPGVYLFAF